MERNDRDPSQSTDDHDRSRVRTADTAAPVGPESTTGGLPELEGMAVDRSDQPTQKSAFRLGNRPPLTGIRAFGIAAVLVYHANFKT